VNSHTHTLVANSIFFVHFTSLVMFRSRARVLLLPLLSVVVVVSARTSNVLACAHDDFAKSRIRMHTKVV